MKDKKKRTSNKGRKENKEELFEQIKEKAFKLWQAAGKPKGKDWEFWFQAERDIRK